VNYQLIQNYKYSLIDIEMMMPWEREIYLSMLIDQVKQEKEERQRQMM
tara:strand:- start:4344 stop:4487 length:144 start_codon:yes stop_codon:yes gene_type:complete